jgi:Flp pilus assembly protein TadD
MNTTSMANAAGRPTGHPVDAKRGVEALYATGHWLLTQDRAADAACVFRAMALLAPEDERSWLALGACHEALGQAGQAIQMYGTGRVLARPSVRCDVARSRLLRAKDREDEADALLEHARETADALNDETLIELVAAERRVR